MPPGFCGVLGPVGDPHQTLRASVSEFSPTVLPTKLFGLAALFRLPEV